jgi:DNA-binding CsgD family transcriptional regulator
MNRLRACHAPRTGPGILILGSTGKCEYLNSTACALIRSLHTAPDRCASEPLPSAMMRVAENVQTLAMSDRAKDWERLEIREVAGLQDPVLIRGFGLPSGKDMTQIRVLLLLEAIGRPESPSRRVKERFQLTDREQTIVETLATGRTNKEIAAELRIKEPTVKAHVRNIMGKTRCSTRTAVVALLLQSEEKVQWSSVPSFDKKRTEEPADSLSDDD